MRGESSLLYVASLVVGIQVDVDSEVALAVDSTAVVSGEELVEEVLHLALVDDLVVITASDLGGGLGDRKSILLSGDVEDFVEVVEGFVAAETGFAVLIESAVDVVEVLLHGFVVKGLGSLVESDDRLDFKAHSGLITNTADGGLGLGGVTNNFGRGINTPSGIKFDLISGLIVGLFFGSST